MRQPEQDIQGSPRPTADEPLSRLSRAQLLAWAGAGITMAALPGVAGAAGVPGRLEFPFFPQIPAGTYSTESMQEILNAVVTANYLGVTGATLTLGNAAAVGLTGW